MVSIKSKGDFKNFNKFVKHMMDHDYEKVIDRYARMGVKALSEATPIDSGETARSWDYEVHYSKGRTEIVWTNSNVTKYGTPVAILIQYGHHTKSGAFVQGIDFINPALKPVFAKLADEIWKEVTSY
jgi:hypothetical protein